MFDWYRESNAKERKTFWTCYSGWALDSYDVQIFSFMLPVLMGVWQLSKADAGYIGTAALISAAFGGWIAGVLSDRFGRVRILVVTVIWFTLFGALAGFAQNYEQLLLARMIQGIGFGGEWAVGAALMAEVINPKHRGKAIGFVQSGFSLGWLMAAVVAVSIQGMTSPEMSWRITFWISVLPAGIILFFRRGLEDSNAYKRAAQSGQEKASILTVFKPRYLRMTTLASLMVLGIQAAAYSIIVWTPTMLVERGIEKGSLIMTITIMAVGTFIGFVVTSYLTDAWGRRPTLVLMSLISLGATMAYTLLPLDNGMTQLFGTISLGGSIGLFAAVGPLLSELFPTEVRGTCMGFCYNLGKTVGAMCISVVGILAATMTLGPAIALCAGVAYGLTLISLMLLPETRGRDLENVAMDSNADALSSSMAKAKA